MSEPEFKIPDDARVRLKADRAGVYPLAVGGSEGWVRKHRVDPIGDFKMVFLEWDKEHWAYQGMPNLWTFEEHFEVIEPKEEKSMPEEQPERNFLAELAELIDRHRPPETNEAGANPKPLAEKVPDAVSEREQRYLDVLEEAMNFAMDSDAFFLLAVKKTPNPFGGEQEVLIPEVFDYSKTPEAALLAECHITQAAAQAHTDLAVSNIQQLLEDRDHGPSNS